MIDCAVAVFLSPFAIGQDIFESIDKARPHDVDSICILPFFQQVVGVCTISSNIFKSVFDTVSHATDIAIKYKWIKGLPYEECQKLSLASVLRCCETEEYKEVVRNRFKSDERNLPRHLCYILVGIIRAIPIAGTLYSIVRFNELDVRCFNYLKNKFS